MAQRGRPPGQPLVFTVTWSNSNTFAFLNVTIDYGDGHGNSYECYFSCNNGTTTFSHTYGAANDYLVRGGMNGNDNIIYNYYTEGEIIP